MRRLFELMLSVILIIPLTVTVVQSKTTEEIQADLANEAAKMDARQKHIRQAGVDAQDLVDQHVPGTIPDGKQVIVTEKIKTKITAAGTKQKTSQKIVVEDIIPVPPRDHNEIRLGCTDENSGDCKLIAYQLQQQFDGIFNIKIIPQTSSVINLAGIRDNHLDWAIINADSLVFFPKLDIEVITKLQPKYAHLILRRMNNDSIKDLDNLDGNDMMAIDDEHTDSWTTWTILQNTFPDYLLIPTLKHGGFRALNSTRSGFTQGFFHVSDKQGPVPYKANNDASLKMENIKNDAIYAINVRGYHVYNKVYFDDKMYDKLITRGFNPSVATMEIMNLLISSKGWFDVHGDKYDTMYPIIERALANANRGVRAN